MSHAQIQQFYNRAISDQAILKQVLSGTQTPDEFIDKAVALGAETGFSFTREEADGWIKSQIEAKATGELSDLQLEGVAGGKGENTTCSAGLFDEAGKQFASGGITGVGAGLGLGWAGLVTGALGDDVCGWLSTW